jgi:hypothetical protein
MQQQQQQQFTLDMQEQHSSRRPPMRNAPGMPAHYSICMQLARLTLQLDLASPRFLPSRAS